MITRDDDDCVFRAECDECPLAQEIHPISSGWSAMIINLQSKGWDVIAIAGGGNFKTICPDCANERARR